ncbi:MAG: GNAT family N-acetyltransferase [Bacteroidetes bacterium]|nr:GNAT family N-acetyltransferase [Bacteroidota bacterium]
MLRYDILRKPLGLKFDEEQLKHEENEFHFIASFKNKIIGVLLLKPLNYDIVKMRQVAVKKTLQKKGIGKKLVEFAEKWAKENKFSKIELNARLTSIDFYSKNNYKTIGSQFDEVGIPHIKMYKDL